MAEETIRLEPATGGDLDTVVRLLSANDLPTADVRTGAGSFHLAYDGEDRVGVGGLETYGEAGLLRSVVVEETRRSAGYGTAISEGLAERAKAAGVETLYLLTTTATDFFGALGYDPVARAAVPGGIRATTEFADLCPESATPMRKHL